MSLQLSTNETKARFAPSADSQAIARLQHMLTFCRPAGSDSERKFIREFISPLKPLVDKIGNRHIMVGESRVIWCAHTDTVHRKGGRQSVTRLGDKLQLCAHEKANCLGADDTTGVWLMLEMIRARVPGRYVFFRGEEIGGVGSHWLAKYRANMLARYMFAIAFDRRGTQDIITHQAGGRCASDAFAASMATQLPVGYRGDTGGTFTDTANLTEHVGECTNIAVGYESAHSAKETQSVNAALALRDAMLCFNETALVAERKPGEVDPADYRASSWHKAWSDHYGYRDNAELEFHDYRDEWAGASKTASYAAGSSSYGAASSVLRFVESYPELVADMLEHHGIDVHELNAMRQQYYG
jgi:hypothetical protein